MVSLDHSELIRDIVIISPITDSMAASFTNILRRLGEENPMEGCFASAGRGLGQTLRSVEDYISEVISRGVCYIDNTLEDFDEEVKFQKKELVPGGDDGDHSRPDDGKDDQEKTHLMAVDSQVRHRARYSGTADGEFPQQNAMASSEIWDVSGRDSPPYLPSGALACAALVDTDIDPNDVYRLTSDSNAIPNTASVYPNPNPSPPILPPYTSQQKLLTTATEENGNTLNESKGVENDVDEPGDMMDIKLI